MDRRQFIAGAFAALPTLAAFRMLRPVQPAWPDPRHYNLGRGKLYIAPIGSDGKRCGPWEYLNDCDSFEVTVCDEQV